MQNFLITQLDTQTYLTLSFSVMISFLVLYFYMDNYIIPKIAMGLKLKYKLKTIAKEGIIKK
jgi:hypothetical protein